MATQACNFNSKNVYYVDSGHISHMTPSIIFISWLGKSMSILMEKVFMLRGKVQFLFTLAKGIYLFMMFLFILELDQNFLNVARPMKIY